MAPERREVLGLATLIVAVATLLAVAVGGWKLWQGLQSLRPESTKGTFCCTKVDGKGGTGCQKIPDTDEEEARCNRLGKDVLECTGSHSQTADGRATCL